ncbi:MAG: hypothetical protein ACOC32_04235 [Nanoarchaeota archaeon]
MLLQLLGLMDILSAISFLLVHFNIVDSLIMYVPCIYLIMKTIVFWGDIGSMIDGMLGVLLILMISGFRIEYVWIISGFLFLKGLGSFLG